MNNDDKSYDPTNDDQTNVNLLDNNENLTSPTLRSFNIIFMIKMTIMAAIGGFLFGYDTGVIGGANLYFHLDYPDITSSQKEMIVSLAVIGAAVGCILIGPVADIYGRKITIIISDLLFAFGALLVYFYFLYF